MTPAQKQRLRLIVALFDKAELVLREIGDLSGKITVPSINELRYVGYHIAKAICHDDDDSIDNELDRAESHCQRAIYDAYESGLVFSLESIQNFRDAYLEHSDIVLLTIPDYITMLEQADAASADIQRYREEHEKNRKRFYEDCAKHYKTIEAIYKKLKNSAEPLIRAQIIKKNSEDRRQTQRYISTVAIAILAIVVAGLIGFITIKLMP
ncbi:MAG: hypothetical protein HQL49_06645 [Gammaproteobacteria bacterium]|nr:hypothetical protein [Gammaproteobacteria bacterium]